MKLRRDSRTLALLELMHEGSRVIPGMERVDRTVAVRRPDFQDHIQNLGVVTCPNLVHHAFGEASAVECHALSDDPRSKRYFFRSLNKSETSQKIFLFRLSSGESSSVQALRRFLS